MIVDEMTDRQAETYLSSEGIAHGAQHGLGRLSNDTNLVQRVVPEQEPRERLTGYRGPYRINPVFKDALADLLAGSQ